MKIKSKYGKRNNIQTMYNSQFSQYEKICIQKKISHYSLKVYPIESYLNFKIVSDILSVHFIYILLCHYQSILVDTFMLIKFN